VHPAQPAIRLRRSRWVRLDGGVALTEFRLNGCRFGALRQFAFEPAGHEAPAVFETALRFEQVFGPLKSLSGYAGCLPRQRLFVVRIGSFFCLFSKATRELGASDYASEFGAWLCENHVAPRILQAIGLVDPAP
jgi:hypothetical protein